MTFVICWDQNWNMKIYLMKNGLRIFFSRKTSLVDGVKQQTYHHTIQVWKSGFQYQSETFSGKLIMKVYIFSPPRAARVSWRTIPSLTPAEYPRWGSLSTSRLLSRRSRQWSSVTSKTSRCSSLELLKNIELETVRSVLLAPSISYLRNCSQFIYQVCY